MVVYFLDNKLITNDLDISNILTIIYFVMIIVMIIEIPFKIAFLEIVFSGQTLILEIFYLILFLLETLNILKTPLL